VLLNWDDKSVEALINPQIEEHFRSACYRLVARPGCARRRPTSSSSGSGIAKPIPVARTVGPTAAPWAALKTYRKFAQTGAAPVAKFGGNASCWHRLMRGTHPYADGI